MHLASLVDCNCTVLWTMQMNFRQSHFRAFNFDVHPLVPKFRISASSICRSSILVVVWNPRGFISILQRNRTIQIWLRALLFVSVLIYNVRMCHAQDWSSLVPFDKAVFTLWDNDSWFHILYGNLSMLAFALLWHTKINHCIIVVPAMTLTLSPGSSVPQQWKWWNYVLNDNRPS